MTVKASHPSDNMQSPLSVLDVLSLESPESTAGKQRSSFPKLPPLGGQSVNSIFRRSSADGSRSAEGVGLSLPAPRPVLTACATSPTRPNARGRLRVRSSLLSRSSSLNDNKVDISCPQVAVFLLTTHSRTATLGTPMQVLAATQLQRTPSLACPDLFTFGDHFVFEGIIGRSSHSEVYSLASA